MWVQITRVTGLPLSAGLAKIVRQWARDSSVAMPVSTTVQPSPSSSSQRLIQCSANGSGMRTQSTPGAISFVSPAGGGSPQG